MTTTTYGHKILDNRIPTVLLGRWPDVKGEAWVRTPIWLPWRKPWRRRVWSWSMAEYDYEWQYATHTDFLTM